MPRGIADHEVATVMSSVATSRVSTRMLNSMRCAASITLHICNTMSVDKIHIASSKPLYNVHKAYVRSQQCVSSVGMYVYKRVLTLSPICVAKVASSCTPAALTNIPAPWSGQQFSCFWARAREGRGRSQGEGESGASPSIL